MSYKCDICHIDVGSFKASIKHKITIHGATYKCSICDMMFFYPSSLRRHLLAHDERNSFTCGICGKKSAQKSNHERHLLRHSIGVSQKTGDAKSKIKHVHKKSNKTL